MHICLNAPQLILGPVTIQSCPGWLLMKAEIFPLITPSTVSCHTLHPDSVDFDTDVSWY